MGYQFDWNLILHGQYRDWIISGLVITLELSIISIVGAFALGTFVAVSRMSPLKIFRWPALVFLEFVRNTPLLVQIFFWYFGSYKILPKSVNDWLNETGHFEFMAAAMALTIYTSAFIAEDIRSGVRAIPPEQTEAGRASGFSYLQTMRFIVLPQAVRISVPPIVNQFLNLAKNSSLAMTIGVAELTYQARQIESHTLRGFEAFAVATTIYLILSLAITAFVHLYENRFFRRKAAL